MNKKIEYNEISHIIEKLIILKRKEWKIFTTDYEEVAQEIRIFCSNVMEKFNPERGKNIEVFLNRCITNFIKKKMRDDFFYALPPCAYVKCGYNDKIYKECTSPSGACNKMKNYLNRKEQYDNFNLYGVIRIDSMYDRETTEDGLLIRSTIEQDFDVKVIIEETEKRLSDKQRNIYRMWRTGYSATDIAKNLGYSGYAPGEIVRYHLKKIKRIIDKILVKYYRGDL